jgi:sterol desaturase/sphingolipid hydroxylase (fatty acid hydroxylase superfamily)
LIFDLFFYSSFFFCLFLFLRSAFCVPLAASSFVFFFFSFFFIFFFFFLVGFFSTCPSLTISCHPMYTFNRPPSSFHSEILPDVSRSPAHFALAQIRKKHVRYPSQERIWECVREVAVGHALRPLLLWLAYPLVLRRGIALSYGQAMGDAESLSFLGSLKSGTTFPGVAVHLFASIFVGDTVFYWAHRYFHENKWLYTSVHKKHHEFKYVVGVATEYCHPAEDILVNTLSGVAGPLLFGSPVWILVGHIGILLAQSIDAHGGLDLSFPLSCWNVLPYSDCAVAHDFHHSNNVGNYGGFFSFWDSLCSTDLHYRSHLMKKRQAAAAGRTGSK